MLNTVFASLLVALLCVAHPVFGAEKSSRRCEAETAQLMNLESSWSEIYKAAIALPPACFDGYFAEQRNPLTEKGKNNQTQDNNRNKRKNEEDIFDDNFFDSPGHKFFPSIIK